MQASAVSPLELERTEPTPVASPACCPAALDVAAYAVPGIPHTWVLNQRAAVLTVLAYNLYLSFPGSRPEQEQSGGLWLCSQTSNPSSSYGEIVPGGLQGSTAREVMISAGGGGAGSRYVGAAQVLATGKPARAEADIKYAVIGTAVGIAISAGFLALKFCMIRKHMFDNDSSDLRSTNVGFNVSELFTLHDDTASVDPTSSKRLVE
ncbi:hypothetical protein E5288_WYG016491 [Bos mutus]|uniref:Transmembrane protein 273 n=1 Tax=Bos mutus TaxID=72004 RepID=A0A6B0R6F0_9CETA|nr:hypothetical protein [Bos mutus]